MDNLPRKEREADYDRVGEMCRRLFHEAVIAG